MNHTPTPFEVKYIGRNVYIEPQGRKGFIADLQYTDCQSEEEMGEALANAAFIVRACNAHEELVKSLKEMTTILSAIQNTLTGYLTPDSTLDQDDCINAILNISDHKETLSKQRSALQLLTTIEKGA